MGGFQEESPEAPEVASSCKGSLDSAIAFAIANAITPLRMIVERII